MKVEKKSEFPFFWIENPNMESLKDIAMRLRDKTQEMRRDLGFRGSTTEMEKQIIDHLIRSDQQLLEVTDVVQATLQIIIEQHNNKISQRTKRAFVWVWQKTSYSGRRIWESTAFKIVGGLGTVSFLASVFVYVFHILKK
jgi:hypothetical protein